MDENWVNFNRYYEDQQSGMLLTNITAFESFSEKTNICFKAFVDLKSPGPDGTFSPQEIDGFQDFDDALDRRMSKLGAIRCGRLNYKGSVTFYFYGDLKLEKLKLISPALEKEFGYKVEWDTEEDPNQENYWNYLYPSRAEFRIMADLQVVETLNSAGDSGRVLRRIDHWVILPDEDSLKIFSVWAEEKGFKIETEEIEEVEDDEDLEEVEEEEEPGIELHLYHDTTATIENIIQFTVMLDAKAFELNGNYDGWEAFVVKDEV